MSEPTLSLADVHAKRVEIFKDAESVNAGLRSFIEWLRDSSDRLNVEAREYLTDLLDTLFQGQAQLAEEKRATKEASEEDTEAETADDLVAHLESEPEAEDPRREAFSESMLSCTQMLLSSLRQIERSANYSEDKRLFLRMFSAIVDELTVAHVLSRHGYAVQADAHLRTVLETLDRMELFSLHPESIGQWLSEPEREELRPEAVRQKLQRDTFDPIYRFLSDRGVRMLSEWGSASRDALEIQTMGLSLLVANQSVARLVGTFGESLNRRELESALPFLISQFRGFMENHFLPWAKEHQLDTQVFADFLEQLPPPPGNTH